MIYLASQSPRRQELLRQLGVRFEIVDVELVVQRKPLELPADYVSRVARDKALAGLSRHVGNKDAIVLGADTDVVVDEDVLGKPADAAEAYTMLKRLSGRRHEVLSSVWLVSEIQQRHDTMATWVTFSAMSDVEIHAYIATGEPFGKAGAYAVQGKAAAFIENIEGSFSGVMGLPLHETYRLLRNFNVPFWTDPT
jgi:septum formation protein